MNYREVEKKYQELVAQRKSGRLTTAEWEQQLKALLLQDLKGRYWTIGAQTGKWYYYDGTKWTEGEPEIGLFDGADAPAPAAAQPQTRTCPHCGFENQLQRALCSRCGKDMRTRAASAAATPRDLTAYCPACGGRVSAGAEKCGNCGRALMRSDQTLRTAPAQPQPVVEEMVLTRGGQTEFVEASTGTGRHGIEQEIRALNLVSCFKFMGGAGVIIGLVVGVFAGALRDMGIGPLQALPLIGTLKGRWLGGLVFGLVGAATCGLLSGIYGTLLGFLYNLLAIIFGGIRIRISRSQ